MMTSRKHTQRSCFKTTRTDCNKQIAPIEEVWQKKQVEKNILYKYIYLNRFHKFWNLERFGLDMIILDLKFEIREGRFFCLNSLLKSVHFEHFWVDHDRTPEMKHLGGMFFLVFNKPL